MKFCPPATKIKIFFWTMAKRMKVESITTNSIESSTDLMPNESTSNSKLFIRLQGPTKSQLDKKEYSVIQLKNKLTALVISDKLHPLNLEQMTNSIDTSTSNGSVTSSENSSDEESDDEIAAKSYDEADSTQHASQQKLAACALSIGVGSFSDPENIPGLAHFLEHMIFMGSEKYPRENEFDVYIKKKGGSDNAATECESTTFYFDCHESHLKGGMDIFSQLFISPLMKRDSMTKERESIESEFQMALPCDESRRSQLLCSLAETSNPAHKFLWGNLNTLRDKVKDDELYDSVHEFRKKYYSAHRMTLVVQARLPIETLEDWVVECFDEIHNNSIPTDKFNVSGSPFKENCFHKLYMIEPVKDISTINLTWVMPSTIHLYRSKPLNYLSWVIGHEGKGSLLSYLKKKMWCFSLLTSGGGDGTEENSIYSLFSISLNVTKEGIKHIEEIVSLVFMYIKMFQNEGPQQRLFEEMQKMAETNFKYFEEVSPSENVEQLSQNMQVYPPADYITGPDLYFEYNPELIKSLLGCLRADNVNIMVSSKALTANEHLDKTEPWFGTKYKENEIPPEWVKNWQNGPLCGDFHLPGLNPFIPTNYDIVQNPEKPGEYPNKVLNQDGVELWFKQDVTFKLPHAFCFLHLVSPLSKKSPENAAMMDLMIEIIRLSLSEELYPATVAELGYSFHQGEKGMIITVSGFNDKLKYLLNSIINGIRDVIQNIEPGKALIVQDELQRSYLNSSLKTGNLARDVRMSILLETYWTALDKMRALKNVTVEMLNEFASQYSKELYIQCLIQGNLTEDEAIQFVNIVKNGLSCVPPSIDVPEIRVHKLSLGERFCVVQSLNYEDVNSTVTNYYQSGLGTIQESCIIEMLIMMMEEPLFDTLRTKQQLGYDVSCVLNDTFGILGFSISVHCQCDRHSTYFVENCISEFLKDFAEILRNTAQEDFKEVQESLKKLKECEDNHLKEEVKRNWGEIKTGEYIFNRLFREKEIIEKLTLEDLVNWFDTNAGLQDPVVHRKLSIQVVGTSLKKDQSCKTEKSCKSNSHELYFLPQQETTEKFISDISDFKKSLYLHPPHKTI